MHMDTQGQNTIATADVSSIAKTFFTLWQMRMILPVAKVISPFTAIAQFITLAIV